MSYSKSLISFRVTNEHPLKLKLTRHYWSYEVESEQEDADSLKEFLTKFAESKGYSSEEVINAYNEGINDIEDADGIYMSFNSL